MPIHYRFFHEEWHCLVCEVKNPATLDLLSYRSLFERNCRYDWNKLCVHLIVHRQVNDMEEWCRFKLENVASGFAIAVSLTEEDVPAPLRTLDLLLGPL